MLTSETGLYTQCKTISMYRRWLVGAVWRKHSANKCIDWTVFKTFKDIYNDRSVQKSTKFFFFLSATQYYAIFASYYKGSLYKSYRVTFDKVSYDWIRLIGIDYLLRVSSRWTKDQWLCIRNVFLQYTKVLLLIYDVVKCITRCQFVFEHDSK